jgi:hypothetical protein
MSDEAATDPPMTWGEALWCWAGFIAFALGLLAIHPGLLLIGWGAMTFYVYFSEYSERCDREAEKK